MGGTATLSQGGFGKQSRLDEKGKARTKKKKKPEKHLRTSPIRGTGKTSLTPKGSKPLKKGQKDSKKESGAVRRPDKKKAMSLKHAVEGKGNTGK